jgi:LysM repeat protein
LNSWSVLGNMAITGNEPDSQPSPPSSPAEPVQRTGGDTSEESYTVQRGDYLIALAERFGTTWEELARINAIYYPYTIFPGQTLTLPGQPVTITDQVYLPVMRYNAPLTTSP